MPEEASNPLNAIQATNSGSAMSALAIPKLPYRPPPINPRDLPKWYESWHRDMEEWREKLNQTLATWPPNATPSV